MGGFVAELSAVDRLITRLVYAQRGRAAKLVNALLRLRGTDISHQARIGPGLVLPHGAIGVVVHPRTTIGKDVTIYQNVTVGRADIWRSGTDFAGITIEDGVILGAGAVVLAGPEGVTLGKGSILGANAVLTQSTGLGEVWAGNPARMIRQEIATAP